MTNDFSWRDTLSDYLLCSNEDEITVEGFRTVVGTTVTHRTVTWLEVGPGPGSKTCGFYKVLVESGATLLNAVALEIDSSWRGEFEARVKTISNSHPGEVNIEFRNASLSSAQSFTCAVSREVSRVVTCCHVLYTKELAYAMARYLRTESNNTRNFCAFLTVEAPDSDFNILRNMLFDFGCSAPANAGRVVQAALSAENLNVEVRQLGKQYCRIDSPLPDWLCPFILGWSKWQFDGLSLSRRNDISTVVRDFVYGVRNGTLLTPDVAFVVRSY